jgi:drug/metabolite transporter (DMT)-like permease
LLAGRDTSQLVTVLERKGAASLNSLTVTRWTYFIPVGIAVLVLLLLRPRGILRDVLPQRPLLRAGLWGTLLTGVLGFAVNDSGISISALALAFTVPFLVLIAVDTVDPRTPKTT